MYSIVLTDGKIINIKADQVEWGERSQMARFLNNGKVVARISMNTVVGWIDADYKAESEDEE